MADVAVVGTSPVLLLEAAARAKAGSQVTVFTNHQNFGGAWWVDSQAGFDNVETACHLLEADTVGYEVLQTIPGVGLAPMTPAPKVHIGKGQALRYGSPSATAAIAAIGLPAVARAGWREGRTGGAAAGARAARTSASIRLEQGRNDLQTRHQAILYPTGGAGALLEGLRSLLRSAGVQFDHRRIEHIVTDDPSALVKIEGENLSFERAVISSGYDGSIGPTGSGSRTGQRGRRAEELAKRTHDHLLLVIPTEVLQPLSYDRFMVDPVLLRASDVTATASTTNPSQLEGRSLLMLGTRRPVDPDQVMGPLLHTGLLTEPVEPDHAVVYTHTSRDRAKELAVTTADSPIDFVPTFGDLSRSLRGFAERHPGWLAAEGHHVSH